MHIAWEKSFTDYLILFYCYLLFVEVSKIKSHIGTQIKVSFVLWVTWED